MGAQVKKRYTQYILAVVVGLVIVAIVYRDHPLSRPLLMALSIVSAVTVVMGSALLIAWRVHKRKAAERMAAFERDV